MACVGFGRNLGAKGNLACDVTFCTGEKKGKFLFPFCWGSGADKRSDGRRVETKKGLFPIYFCSYSTIYRYGDMALSGFGDVLGRGFYKSASGMKMCGAAYGVCAKAVNSTEYRSW